MQKTLVFEMPESIINKIMDKNEDFKMQFRIDSFGKQNVFLSAFCIFCLVGKIDENCITFILDGDKDFILKDFANKYLENGDYDVVFYYDLLHKVSEGFSQNKENSFFIKKDKNFYCVKIDAEGKQVFSEEFKNEDEFRNYTKVLNLKDDLKKIHKIITALVVLSIILVAASLLTLGLFTGGVAPAILTPLIAKCLIGVLGGISLTGFFTTLLIFCLIKIFRNKRDAKQNEIDDIQKEINPTEQKIENLKLEKYKIEDKMEKIESDSKKAEDINNGPEMLKNGNEYGDNNL